MRYNLGLFLILCSFWVLNSPNDSGLLLFLGLMSVIFVFFLTIKMKLLDRESMPLHLVTRIWPFYGWLVKEIILGSFYVLKRIVLRDKSLSPQYIILNLKFNDELSEVIFANSITLVPGTLSVKMTPGKLQVHVLSEELAEDLRSGELENKIKGLEI